MSSEWLSMAGFERFEQKLLSDEIGVGEDSWRTDIKELDLDACKLVGLSVVQVMLWTAWHVPHSHFFSFSSFFRLLHFGTRVMLTGEEVRTPGGPCDQLGIARLFQRLIHIYQVQTRRDHHGSRTN